MKKLALILAISLLLIGDHRSIAQAAVDPELGYCTPERESFTQIYAMTDATTNAWGATVQSGGTLNALVWCNGTNWTVIGQ